MIMLLKSIAFLRRRHDGQRVWRGHEARRAPEVLHEQIEASAVDTQAGVRNRTVHRQFDLIILSG